jgi:hypothetical protein
MDDRCLPTPDGALWSVQFAAELDQRRQRAEEFLSTQRHRLAQLEGELAEKVARLGARLASEQAQAGERSVALDERAAAVAAQADALDRLRAELTQQQLQSHQQQEQADQDLRRQAQQLRQREEELDQRQVQQAAAETAFRQAQRELALGQEELAADRSQLARSRARVDQQLQQLEEDRDQLAHRQAQTNNQRREIARQLQEQRAAQRAEYEKQRAELAELANWAVTQSAQHDEQLADALADRERLQAEAVAQRTLADQRADEVARLHTQLKRLSAENERLQADFEHLQQETTLREGARPADADWQSRCEQLTADLHQAHAQADAARTEAETLRGQLVQAQESATAGDDHDDEDRREELAQLQRRFELAVEDVRDLKRRNAELEARLTEARSAGGGSAPGRDHPPDRLDWEAQKRRLLAALEADDRGDDEEAAQERMTIEGTIRITDEVVIQKDRELAELRQLLDEQSANIGSVAIGAAAVAELFDHDELIQQERKRLDELRQEWEEKLRKAEIDMSVERAKISRDRASLEERLQALESAQARAAADAPSASGNSRTKDSGRGRWLQRLGLKDDQ